MDHNPVGWFEIYVEDMPRAKAFYENVFQAKLEKLNNPEIEMWTLPYGSRPHRVPRSIS